MSMLVSDPEWVRRFRAEREGAEGSQHDEVWDGVYMLMPLPNIQHQKLAHEIAFVFREVVAEIEGGEAFGPVNVSDRVEGWAQNYREPDAGVILKGGRARDCGTHYCGGPDFLVEILSPHDLARDKIPFYSEIGVRELLIVERKPWALELYRLAEGHLVLAGRSDLEDPAELVSEVLPLSFRLVTGPERPMIEAAHRDGRPRWLV